MLYFIDESLTSSTCKLAMIAAAWHCLKQSDFGERGGGCEELLTAILNYADDWSKQVFSINLPVAAPIITTSFLLMWPCSPASDSRLFGVAVFVF